MKTFSAFTFFFILFGFSSCEKNVQTVSKNLILLTTEQKQIVTSSNNFGFDIFKEVVKNSKPDENTFISPLSISLALTMLYNGSATITRDELETSLGYKGLSNEQVNVANRDLIQALLKADPKVVMQIANSIWYKNSFTVEPDFIAVNKNYFDAEVKAEAFDNETKDLINNWVSNKTNKKILTIIDEIPADVVMYLINAIYFKGIWQYQFESKLTQKMDFSLSPENKIQTDFMTQESTFEYAKNDLFSAINLPYGDGHFSMLILLPGEEKTCQDIVNAMSDENWTNWNNSMVKQNIKVFLPKFKFEFFRKINDELATLGMSSMFGSSADLTGINKIDDIYVSRVLHKTFVEVNEEGTEAAAVTAVEIAEKAVFDGPEIFRADKPFIFVIKEKDTNTLMFMGILNNPQKEK